MTKHETLAEQVAPYVTEWLASASAAAIETELAIRNAEVYRNRLTVT